MDAVERYRKRRRDRLTERMRNAATPEEAQRLAIIIYTNCYRQDGGPGSGNWGHESVPGVRGGSKPGGGTSHRQGSAEKGYTSAAKEKQKAKEAAKTGTKTVSHTPNKPARPKKADFADENGEIDYDAFYAARENYHAEKAAWDAEIDKRVAAEVPEHSMSVDEVEKWCEKTGTSIYGTIEGVDGRLLTAYTQRFEQLSADFPEALSITTTLDDETFTSGFELSYTGEFDYICEASHGISFGVWCKDAEEVSREMLASQSQNEKINTGQGLTSLFDHEYGHRVYDAMRWSEGRTTQDRIAMRQDLISSLYGKSGMSDYATTNEDELFAEGFAAYYGGETTDFAKATGEFIEKWRKT